MHLETIIIAKVSRCIVLWHRVCVAKSGARWQANKTAAHTDRLKQWNQQTKYVKRLFSLLDKR